MTTIRNGLSSCASWLKPLDVSLYAQKADFKAEKIKSGTRFTFVGSATPVSGYYDNFDLKEQLGALADFDDKSFYFVIDHAATNDDSFYPVDCADAGYAVTSSNATTAGMPLWNETTNSLDFNVFGPHRTTQGVLNEGYFKLWVSQAYADCRWPENDLSSQPYVTVHVLDANGDEEWAITQVSSSNGQISLSVSGFHYSSPTIAVKASATKQKSPGPKPKNFPPKRLSGSKIVCVSKSKSSLRINLMGVNPKCPSGFKKK
jgi:hypothetical protein